MKEGETGREAWLLSFNSRAILEITALDFCCRCLPPLYSPMAALDGRLPLIISKLHKGHHPPPPTATPLPSEQHTYVRGRAGVAEWGKHQLMNLFIHFEQQRALEPLTCVVAFIQTFARKQIVNSGSPQRLPALVFRLKAAPRLIIVIYACSLCK